jgi:hypothetical protein
MAIRRPVLLVEGPGDKEAVPALIRSLASHLEIYDLQPAPHPITCRDLVSIGRPDQLEKFVEYACMRDDGDAVLLVVDCDDDCPATSGPALAARALPIAERYRKKVGIVLLYREFESLFLLSLASIRESFKDYDWRIEELPSDEDLENKRGAKELLRKAMGIGIYKETRDQVRFVTALDFERLQSASRAFRHLTTTLEWLRRESSASWVHPASRE